MTLTLKLILATATGIVRNINTLCDSKAPTTRSEERNKIQKLKGAALFQPQCKDKIISYFVLFLMQCDGWLFV